MLLDRLQRQRETVEKQAQGLVYKQRNPPPAEVYSQRINPQPPGGYMDDAQQKPWNDWAVAVARQVAQVHCEALAKIVGEAMSEDNAAINANFERRVKADEDLQTAIDELRDLVAELAARVDALEGGDNGDARRVLTLPKVRLKGRIDAA